MKIAEIVEAQIIPFPANDQERQWRVIGWNGIVLGSNLNLPQAEQAARIQSALMQKPVLVTDGQRVRRTVKIDGRWSLGGWERAVVEEGVRLMLSHEKPTQIGYRASRPDISSPLDI